MTNTVNRNTYLFLYEKDSCINHKSGDSFIPWIGILCLKFNFSSYNGTFFWIKWVIGSVNNYLDNVLYSLQILYSWLAAKINSILFFLSFVLSDLILVSPLILANSISGQSEMNPGVSYLPSTNQTLLFIFVTIKIWSC